MPIKPKINMNLKSVHKYLIAIPTYKRYDILNTHTLAVLEKHKIDLDKINIFVANESEADSYKQHLDSKYHNKIIIGKKGLKNQRNFISSYFPEKQCIVQMDDDIKEIYYLDHPDKKDYEKWINLEPSDMLAREFRKRQTLIPVKGLNKLFHDFFKKCIIEGSYIWGVYPTANSYFMTFFHSTELKFIVGPLFGIINIHDSRLKLTLDEKEDSERTLQYFSLDGIVIRFNDITIETDYYRNQGGMQAENKDRKKEASKSVAKLHKKYPKLTKPYIRKSSGIPEIKLLKKSKP